MRTGKAVTPLHPPVTGRAAISAAVTSTLRSILPLRQPVVDVGLLAEVSSDHALGFPGTSAFAAGRRGHGVLLRDRHRAALGGVCCTRQLRHGVAVCYTG